jgi:hypothetical protein
MGSFLERIALRLVGLVLVVVLWPFVALSMVADALAHIDARSEDI